MLPDSTNTRWFRLNLWLHRWAGLLATLPFLVLCITGSLLVFHEEIDHALGVLPEGSSSGGPELPLSDVVSRVLAEHPGERVLSLGIDSQEHEGVLAVVTGPREAIDFEKAQLRYADLTTGAPASGNPNESFTRFLLELHAQWFLGPIGELLGALIALLVLVALFSGVVVYAPYVRKFAFGLLRRGKSPRLVQLDLHNFLGAITLGWALVVTSTGFLLGFGSVLIGLWQVTALGELRARTAHDEAVQLEHLTVGPDRAREVASAAVPGWRVTSIIYPFTNYSTQRHYTVLLAGQEGAEERLLRVAIVDAKTGALSSAPPVPSYIQAVALSEPLHFGDYGGLPLKILWTLCTWLTLFITGNGAWLWWDRRRLKRLSPATRGGEVSQGDFAAGELSLDEPSRALVFDAGSSTEELPS
ncbi:MAG TPA: PepSY-associated TM helix domain-containing protein [Polyangiaceae bacterium]|nr:PepSY-associated TM helix domain-containing protein [Polyangiaceae bacterium]